MSVTGIQSNSRGIVRVYTVLTVDLAEPGLRQSVGFSNTI